MKSRNLPSGARTCLAGDVIGDYSFDEMPKIGDRLVFGDMAIYSMVKNNTFNGMPLPDIALRRRDAAAKWYGGSAMKISKGGFPDMALLHTLPTADGFTMPAEFAPHSATVLIWPVRPGSWGRDPSVAQRAFLDVIREIAKEEDVYLLAGAEDAAAARAAVADLPRITVHEIESDDAWARDVGPTFVTDGKTLRGISWRFNAWGGTVDGLYANWDKDDAVAAALCEALGVDCYDAGDFVLEGGSIHVDGEGTLLTTEACLLSAGRNPSLTREQIEQKLAAYLGIRKILWLPRGIYLDETNEHVDNVCAFTAPGESCWLGPMPKPTRSILCQRPAWTI